MREVQERKGERCSTVIPKFPKPSQLKKTQEAVKVYRDGREVCQNNTAGKAEYERRRRIAWEDQEKRCNWCDRCLRWDEATTDHIRPRGMGGGRRDDRQENIAAVHGPCNMEKGSRRIE